VSWRQSLGYLRRPERRLRALIGAVLIALIGVMATLAGLDEAIRNAGTPVSLMNWIWACANVATPVFYLHALQGAAARDELERQLAAAAERDPLTRLPNRTGFAAQGLVPLAAHWATTCGPPMSLRASAARSSSC
jgi:hypothetical protein